MSETAVSSSGTIQVELLGNDDLVWGYRDDAPYYSTGKYRNAKVDPTPCYHHDLSLVAECVAEVQAKFPPAAPVRFLVLSHEEVGRTNGHSAHQRAFYEPPGTPDSHEVVLSGKRIPIHPAMTRYLVAHEYGHHVQWWVQEALGHKYDYDHEFEEEVYAPLRGMEHCSAAPGTWHKATGEVFACDFRMLIAQVELDYWPHVPVERPTATALLDWWQAARELDFSAVAKNPEPDDDA